MGRILTVSSDALTNRRLHTSQVCVQHAEGLHSTCLKLAVSPHRVTRLSPCINSASMQNKKSRNPGVPERARQFRTPAALLETLGSSPSTRTADHTVVGDPMLSSGFFHHRACTSYTDTHTGKILKHIAIFENLKTPHSKLARDKHFRNLLYLHGCLDLTWKNDVNLSF